MFPNHGQILKVFKVFQKEVCPLFTQCHFLGDVFEGPITSIGITHMEEYVV